jgi:hypothetical protein
MIKTAQHSPNGIARIALQSHGPMLRAHEGAAA